MRRYCIITTIVCIVDNHNNFNFLHLSVSSVRSLYYFPFFFHFFLLCIHVWTNPMYTHFQSMHIVPSNFLLNGKKSITISNREKKKNGVFNFYFSILKMGLEIDNAMYTSHAYTLTHTRAIKKRAYFSCDHFISCDVKKRKIATNSKQPNITIDKTITSSAESKQRVKKNPTYIFSMRK